MQSTLQHVEPCVHTYLCREFTWHMLHVLHCKRLPFDLLHNMLTHIFSFIIIIDNNLCIRKLVWSDFCVTASQVIRLEEDRWRLMKS